MNGDSLASELAKIEEEIANVLMPIGASVPSEELNIAQKKILIGRISEMIHLFQQQVEKAIIEENGDFNILQITLSDLYEIESDRQGFLFKNRLPDDNLERCI